MKKILIIPIVFVVAMFFQSCSEEDPTHADGHIHGTVEYHHIVDGVEVHDEVVGSTVSMWFNKSTAEGAADFTATTDALGGFEFEELQNGIYFITAVGLVDNVSREGSALATLDESSHEVEVELEIE